MVHDTFNVADLSPYYGTSRDEEDKESRTTLSQGGYDVVRPTHDTPSGPMTRARVKAIHAKVNSLLSMCDLDTPLNGLLLHSDTLCVLSYGGPEDPYEDGQGSTEVGQESSQEDDEEDEEKMEKNFPGGGTTAGSSGTTAPG